MKNILTYLISLFLLCSCSAQKRCDRRIKKALPCTTYQSDTIVRLDTLYGFKADTLFIGKNGIDTFYQDTGGIKVKTIVKWNTRTINQRVIKKDTIIKTKVITNTPPPQIEYIRPKWVNGLVIGLMAFILLLLLLVYALFKKR